MSRRKFSEHFLDASCALLLGAGFVGIAAADYPDKPIDLIVPYGKGGAADVAAGILESVAEKYIDQSLIIAYRTGAGGTVGAYLVANAEPDGYTMMIARVGSHSVNPALKANLPYSINDFRYIGVFELNPVVCATSAKSGIESMEELVAKVKTGDEVVTYSFSGAGSLLHLAGPLVLDAFGVENVSESITHMPFRGGGDAVLQVVNGNVTFVCTNSSSMMRYFLDGSLVPLMIVGSEGVDGVEAPTSTELDHEELDVLVGWSGVAGPKDLDQAAFDAWVAWLASITADQEFRSSLEARGSIPTNMRSEEAAQFIQQQSDVFEQLARRLNLRVE